MFLDLRRLEVFPYVGPTVEIKSTYSGTRLRGRVDPDLKLEVFGVSLGDPSENESKGRHFNYLPSALIDPPTKDVKT